MKIRIGAVIAAFVMLCGSVAFGWGGHHGSCALPRNSQWPTGLYEALNKADRVDGYWINSSDRLYYEGNGASLNKMLWLLAALEPRQIVAPASGKDSTTSPITIQQGPFQPLLVIHAGKGVSKSPMSNSQSVPTDWSVYVSDFRILPGEPGQACIDRTLRIRVDVWLGGQLSLSQLDVPSEFSLESGGESDAAIEAFIESRKSESNKDEEPE